MGWSQNTIETEKNANFISYIMMLFSSLPPRLGQEHDKDYEEDDDH